jgi:hypothetical protein
MQLSKKKWCHAQKSGCVVVLIGIVSWRNREEGGV